ncbi:hypothetical protein GFS31_24060 [Leptolyngbya sp. BL0902]|uniref:hypothetical protein n=1 Tax=Leptolyngbya sp. BL0902 TaxID=1115757 RepID=UPI0018E800EB|nr:hypothetical protein [Leptolyngbya sp. BL0902]QQE65718.1 hypothetical protein GFS31_24060 [Leptolyngbya sp. BL0902]
MFQIYFGAFDFVLYLAGIYAAMTLAKAICDQMDAADAAQAVDQNDQVAEQAAVQAPETVRTMAPMQPIPAHLSAPVPKQREEVGVKVSVNG